jgi:endoribonuclease Dicer
MEKEIEEFSPREYQMELLEIVKRKNSILYLPTGSGKTYIAILLIKSMSGSLQM